MVEGGKYNFYHNDHLGTPQKMTDQTGNVVWSATYSGFGEATVDAGSIVVNNLRFPGQYFDEETGLHYNWQRYYDPESGRYEQVDPIGFDAGDLNLHRYAQNNTTLLSDPEGLAVAIPVPGLPLFPPLLPQAIPGTKENDRLTDSTIAALKEASKVIDSVIETAKDKFMKKCEQHRGRIQAQGGGLEKSASWAQKTPLTLSQGLALLTSLEAQLTLKERKQRELGLIQAKRFMINAAIFGGIGPTSKTFPGRGNPIRIDIEVNSGLAFIP